MNVIKSCRLQTWSCIKHMCTDTARPLKVSKPKSKRKQSQHFVDFKKVTAHGGAGGNGAMSFLSLPFKEWAGPDGGNGGNGGHVIFQASNNVKSLQNIASQYRAKDGEKGYSKHCHGKNAEHLYVLVPVGTMFRDHEGKLLADLGQEDQLFVAARGGAGGKGNHFFLTNENRAPMVYEEGGKPQVTRLAVELRVMADVGLVGFPNAGKSTLLRAISRAKPRVAAYPFTTLRPYVGIVEYDDHEQLAVADIPGLIRGAHLNRGLGFAFLRHIERCRCLLYVLDLSVDEPWEQLEHLQFELEQFRTGLSQRPHAVVANKIDLQRGRANLDELRRHTDLEVLPLSAKRRLHIEELLVHLRSLYDRHESTDEERKSDVADKQFSMSSLDRNNLREHHSKDTE